MKDNTEIKFPSHFWYFYDNLGGIWFEKLKNKKFKMGIEAITAFRAGKINKISFNGTNRIVKKTKPIFRIESNKPGCCGSTFIEVLHAPWDIKLIKYNPLIVSNPSIISENPYNTGWIYIFELMEDKISLENYENNISIISPNNEKHLQNIVKGKLRRLKLISLGI